MGDRPEVVALVGPAGTGKSHRASWVADEVGADAILDDGLLVRWPEGRIVAGRSAKREATRMGAVRRAIFADHEDRAAMRAALAAMAPERLLVLATSRRMAEHVTRALGLPPPARYLDIAEVASPEDIRMARLTRRVHGKHVIPAPTVEVQRGFSGYWLDPLRLLWRGRHTRLVEKTVVRPTWSYLGRFTVADRVVVAIAARAARQVAGVARVTGVTLPPAGEEGVALAVEVAVSLPCRVPAVLRRVQAEVARTVEHMTALRVVRVDVTARSAEWARPPASVRGEAGAGRDR